jgi:molybdopterin converting factor small subunit
LKVLFYGDALEYTNGDKSFDFTGDNLNLQKLIDKLSDHYGECFQNFLLGDETCFFLINGKGIMMTGGLNTKLNRDDKIEILPFVKAG